MARDVTKLNEQNNTVFSVSFEAENANLSYFFDSRSVYSNVAIKFLKNIFQNYITHLIFKSICLILFLTSASP